MKLGHVQETDRWITPVCCGEEKIDLRSKAASMVHVVVVIYGKKNLTPSAARSSR